MKYKELQSMFDHFIKTNKVKADRSRHEGEGNARKYVTAKNFTFQLKTADARLGNRATIAMNVENGCVHPIMSYMTYDSLYNVMQYSEINLKKKIKEYKSRLHGYSNSH